MLECPPKWVLLNEIIEEIKIEFNSRLNKSTLPSNEKTSNDNNKAEMKIPKSGESKGEKVKVTETVDLSGGERGSKDKDKGIEGESKNKDKGVGVGVGKEGGEGNVIELVDGNDDTGEQESRKNRENDEKVEQENGKEIQNNGEETVKMSRTKAALNSVLLLRKLNSGCVLIIVKDERTASQVRDYLIHGQVTF